jgi:hypothetical protein
MESFLDDYLVFNYVSDYTSMEYIKECYEKLITIKGRGRFNSIIIMKRYKGNVYREDISVISRLSHINNEDVSDDKIEYLYKNNYLTYDEFVKKYDNCTDKRDIDNFALYLIDHLQPEPIDIKIALKN